MMTPSELKKVLIEPDLRTRPARAAQQYVANKGFDARPFGYLPVEGACYFYYRLPSEVEGHHDLLELEVLTDGPADKWERTATCFRSDV